MTATEHRPASVILRLTQVMARTGLARSTLYERIKDGAFPAQISLGARAVGWLESDIEAWIARQVDISRAR
ncbi:MAG: AlpA family transcriptional regulator [Burkholderiales bacterium]